MAIIGFWILCTLSDFDSGLRTCGTGYRRLCEELEVGNLRMVTSKARSAERAVPAQRAAI